LLEALAGRDSFDVIAEYAAPLPTIVIAELLGVDAGDFAQFKRWSDARSQIFNGTVNLSGRVISDAGEWQWALGSLPTHATDFGPDLEFLGPGSSMLGGSDVIAAKLEEVIDLIVG
jgi:hypothetical protein